jgi:hypothetical protein
VLPFLIPGFFLPTQKTPNIFLVFDNDQGGNDGGQPNGCKRMTKEQ